MALEQKLENLYTLLRDELNIKESLGRQVDKLQRELEECKETCNGLRALQRQWMEEKVDLLKIKSSLESDLKTCREKNEFLEIEMRALKKQINKALKGQGQAEHENLELQQQIEEIIANSNNTKEQLNVARLEKDELLCTVVEILSSFTTVLAHGTLSTTEMDFFEIVVYRVAKHFELRRKWISTCKPEDGFDMSELIAAKQTQFVSAVQQLHHYASTKVELGDLTWKLRGLLGPSEATRFSSTEQQQQQPSSTRCSSTEQQQQQPSIEMRKQLEVDITLSTTASKDDDTLGSTTTNEDTTLDSKIPKEDNSLSLCAVTPTADNALPQKVEIFDDDHDT